VMRTTIILLGIAFLLGVANPAGAETIVIDPDYYTIVIDPDDYTIVADPSNPPTGSEMDTSGVSLYTRGGIDPGNELRVFAVTTLVPGSSNAVFGHLGPADSDPPPDPPFAPDFGRSWGGQAFSPDSFEWLEAVFDEPADWVSLDFIRNSVDDTGGHLSANDTMGYLTAKLVGAPSIMVQTNDNLPAIGDRMTLSISAPPGHRIASITASWYDGCSNGELDTLQFGIVPEPSSIVAVLSLIGLACVTLCYRRMRRATA